MYSEWRHEVKNISKMFDFEAKADSKNWHRQTAIAIFEIFKNLMSFSIAARREWFAARGIGENLGHVLSSPNAKLITKLAWRSNGHVDESGPNTCIRLTDGVLFHSGAKYETDFRERRE
jgi:hypothetical protein